ncbi:hypothetical protein B0H14DRAFT_3125733 [Mycena olivaceomarginata]|nr:hypothetical protein B0H14DRAFT_3125733 [Mycena olivaceomarginata]
MACLGNKSALDASYTLTGVKDKISQHWISVLLEKAKAAHLEQLSNKDTRDSRLNNSQLKGEERIALKANIKHRIQKELWDWVIQQPGEFILLPANDPLRLGLDLKAGVHYNILLQTRGLDPHHDTPAEILHTYLLGNDKYVWHDTTKNWDDKKGEVFASRLQAASISGLSLPPPRPRYQIGVFQLHDLCTPLILDLWKATGELGAYLWFPEIKDMRVYLADLQVLVDNLLDIWGLIDPNRILVKGKLHVLPHTLDDTRRFGPCVIFATEIFECWNAIFPIMQYSVEPSLSQPRYCGNLGRYGAIQAYG